MTRENLACGLVAGALACLWLNARERADGWRARYERAVGIASYHAFRYREAANDAAKIREVARDYQTALRRIRDTPRSTPAAEVLAKHAGWDDPDSPQ